MDSNISILFLFLMFSVLIIIQVKQVKEIIVRVRYTFFERIFLAAVSLSLVGFFVYQFNEFIVLVTAFLMATAMNLSPYVSGLTEEGVRVVNRGNISKKYSFDQTSEWVLYKQKKKLKCRFYLKLKNQKLNEAEYLFFDKVQETEIIDFLEKRGFYVRIKTEN